jgi:hypothetical protein
MWALYCVRKIRDKLYPRITGFILASPFIINPNSTHFVLLYNGIVRSVLYKT